MFALLFCGILAIGAVFGSEEIDYTGVASRVIKENNIEWRNAGLQDSPEIDSSEHGVSPGARKTNCNCGWANRVKGRIVGGKEYGQHEYPFIAGVSYQTNPLRPHCGSAIISSRHFITAAHCTQKALEKQIGLFVTLADHLKGMTPGAYTIAVDKIIQHEQFNPVTLKNDISLLAVTNTLMMSYSVGPACLPVSSDLRLDNEHVKIIGWGADRVGGPMKARPQKVNMRVIDMQTCNRIWPHHVAVNPATQICTHSKKKSACQGDSGGPVVWRDPETNKYTIVGLVSFGADCGDSKPSIQTSVAAYLPWIMKNIEATTPGQVVCKKE